MPNPFEFHWRTRLVFGAGTVEKLGHFARELHFRKPLLVADPGLREAGHVDRALRLLRTAGITAVPFHDFDVNPDTDMVERGRRVRRTAWRGLHHWTWRRQLPRLREGHQLPGNQRRIGGGLSRLRESRETPTSDDRRSDNGGNGL